MFGDSGVQRLTTHLYDLDYEATHLASSAAAAANADQTILFLFDAHIYPSQKQLLETIQGASKRLAVVLLRDVYDAEYVKDNVLCLTNYGFRGLRYPSRSSKTLFTFRRSRSINPMPAPVYIGVDNERHLDPHDRARRQRPTGLEL